MAPTFDDTVKEIADLKPGLALEGVDVGVHHDGPVHISEPSHRHIKDPAGAVKVGQIVKVQVQTAAPHQRNRSSRRTVADLAERWKRALTE